MDKVLFARLKKVVVAALDLPVSERDAFLDDACKDDTDLRRRAAAMLRSNASSPNVLETGGASPLIERLGWPRSGQGSVESDARPLTPGHVLGGRYRVERFLEHGAMGFVYEVLDQLLSIRVALKTLNFGWAGLEPVTAAVRRLKREVLLARAISHPHVCRTYDVGRDGEGEQALWFLTMELLPGQTLAKLIERHGRMSLDQALPLVEQMTAALGAAHRAGIVHRDFKSGNVMVTEEQGDRKAVVMDFGLALAMAPRRPGTDDAEAGRMPEACEGRSLLVGTPAYMAPEQVESQEVTPASDIYALGVVLYEMVTGMLPFDGDTPWKIAWRRVTDAPPSPRELVPDLEERWEAVILRCLAREPGKRFSRAEDVAAMLEGPRVDGVTIDRLRPRYRLPAEADAFIGRSTELEELHRRLTGTERLVTLLGTGGIGKTRLALHYGWRHLEAWPGGVWFSDLSEARSLDGIASAVARALDVPLGKEDPIVQLGHAIAGRGPSVVILDNFEQVVDHAGATLGMWLEEAAETRFLVTSRERLGLAVESAWELDPLDLENQGPELFAVRAREHRPGFMLDTGDHEILAEIVSMLDGLPLAIELAATRLRVLGLRELRGRLGNRLRVLAGGKRGRHATMRAALDWSLDLLEGWERAAVAQASVFEGGFTVEAAEAVIDLSEWPEAPPVLDVVQSLMDKSWLRARPAPQAPRLDMYTTVKEYAWEKLRELSSTARSSTGASALEAAERRHGAYYAAMGTEEATEALYLHGGMARRVALHVELENLVSACRRAAKRGDGETAAGTFAAAWEVLSLTGPLAAGTELGHLVLGIPGIRSVARARTLRRIGVASSRVGRVEEARQLYEEALTIHRQVGDRWAEGWVLGNLGLVAYKQNRFQEARQLCEEALAIHREVGNRWLEGIALDNLAGVEAEQGRLDEARRHYDEALAIHREVGNRWSSALVLGNLGALDLLQDKTRDVRPLFEEALAIHREVGNRHSEAVVLGNLGSLNYLHGRTAEARRYFEEALTIHREVGERPWEGPTLGNLARANLREGRRDEARQNIDRAIALLRETPRRAVLGSLLCLRAEIDYQEGNLAASRASLTEAEAISESLGATAGSDLVRAIEELQGLLRGGVVSPDSSTA